MTDEELEKMVNNNLTAKNGLDYHTATPIVEFPVSTEGNEGETIKKICVLYRMRIKEDDEWTYVIVWKDGDYLPKQVGSDETARLIKKWSLPGRGGAILDSLDIK
jgi:hypothetical protein